MREDDLEYFRNFYESGEWVRLGLEGEPAMLYSAAESGARGICLFLLENGADVNAGYHGFTPLCGAAASGDSAVVGDLLRSGARVDGNPDTVCTPLLTAIQHRKTKAALRLLEAGAEVNRGHLWSEESPLDLARRFCCLELEQELLARGAKSTYELPECSPGAEREFLRYILERTGRILLEQRVGETAAGPVTVRAAMLPRRQKKLLFTWGVSAGSSPAVELFAEVPMEWHFSSPEPKNRLTVSCLLRCAELLVSGGNLEEGEFLPAGSPECEDLLWPSPRMGIRIFRPRYFADSQAERGVKILGAAPVYTRRGGPEPVERVSGRRRVDL